MISRKCELCGKDVEIGEELSKHKQQHRLDSRLALPKKCPTCNIKTLSRNKWRAHCPKCYGYFYLLPVTDDELKEYRSKPRDSTLTCFLCHKPETESDRGYAEYHAHTQVEHHEVTFYAHERCRKTIADPFFREIENHITRRHGDNWSKSDIDQHDAEECKFLNLVAKLNEGVPIRKIADQLKIDRNKVWRVAKHIAQNR
jgi:hypothetical protein